MLNLVFLFLVKYVIIFVYENGVKVVMCGEMVGDEMVLLFLMGMGLDEYFMFVIFIFCIWSMMKKFDIKEWVGYVDEIIVNYVIVEEV